MKLLSTQKTEYLDLDIIETLLQYDSLKEKMKKVLKKTKYRRHASPIRWERLMPYGERLPIEQQTEIDKYESFYQKMKEQANDHQK